MNTGTQNKLYSKDLLILKRRQLQAIYEKSQTIDNISKMPYQEARENALKNAIILSDACLDGNTENDLNAIESLIDEAIEEFTALFLRSSYSTKILFLTLH